MSYCEKCGNDIVDSYRGSHPGLCRGCEEARYITNLNKRVESLQQKLVDVKSENELLRTRLGAILWSGSLDDKTCGTVQKWAEEYKSALEQQLSESEKCLKNALDQRDQAIELYGKQLEETKQQLAESEEVRKYWHHHAIDSDEKLVSASSEIDALKQQLADEQSKVTAQGIALVNLTESFARSEQERDKLKSILQDIVQFWELRLVLADGYKDVPTRISEATNTQARPTQDCWTKFVPSQFEKEGVSP